MEVRAIRASPFYGSRRHCRSVANAQSRGFLRLLVIVFAGEGLELFRVVLLDGAALPVEALDVVEPCDAVGDPCACGLEAILLRSYFNWSALNLQLSSSVWYESVPSVQRRMSAQPPPQPWSLWKRGLGAMTMQASFGSQLCSWVGVMLAKYLVARQLPMGSEP